MSKNIDCHIDEDMLKETYEKGIAPSKQFCEEVYETDISQEEWDDLTGMNTYTNTDISQEEWDDIIGMNTYPEYNRNSADDNFDIDSDTFISREELEKLINK